MTRYEIYVNGVHRRTYTLKSQAVTWLYMNGFIVQRGNDNPFLVEGVEIRKVEDDNLPWGRSLVDI